MVTSYLTTKNTNASKSRTVRETYHAKPKTSVGRAIIRTNREEKKVSVTPGFRLKKASRGTVRLSPLPYYRKSEQIDYLHGKTTILTTGYDDSVYPPTGPYTWVSLEDTGPSVGWSYEYPPSFQPRLNLMLEIASDRALTKLRLEVKNQKVNLLQAFAERRQTATLIGNTATTLLGMYRDLRKGDLGAAAKHVGLVLGKRAVTRYRKRSASAKTRDDIDQVLSSGVLQLQYGIKPLLSDIIGSYELLLEREKAPLECTVRKSSSDEQQFDWDDHPSQGVRSQDTTMVSVRVQYGATFAVQNEVGRTMSQVGVSNPFLIAWELLPWSFVIDWFIPIGNAISSIDATNGVEFIDGWKSMRVDVKSQSYQSIRQTGPTTQISDVSMGYQMREFRREVLSGFPSPALPHFKSPFSIEHAINAVALLAGFKKDAYANLFRKAR